MPTADASAPQAVGARLELGEVVAQGGMGWVRVAAQPELDRQVAVKCVRPELRSSRRYTRHLVHEARVTGALEHPNIVPVHGLGYCDADGPMLVMKRVRGRAWSAEIDELPDLPDAQTLDRHLQILIQITNAVAFAHSRRIVHLDVKPDNVMVGDFGEAYLIDWGIAMPLDELGVAGFEVLGTPVYMAPEMASPEQPNTPRSDVYLLGGCLYEVLAGRPPHEVSNLEERIERGASLPDELPMHVPEPLAAICLRALAPDPADRFRGAEQLRDALIEYRRHRPSHETTERAYDALDDLETAIAVLASDPDGLEDTPGVLEVQRRFGACRFGFEQALREWPDNAAAAEGLRRAMRAMIDHEIARGNPAAASRLMARLDDPGTTATIGLDEATRRRMERERAARDLERAMREARLTSRSRTGSYLALLDGAVLAAICALIYWTEQVQGRTDALPWAMGILAWLGLGGLAFVATRESFEREPVHRRRLAGLRTTAMAMNLAMALGAWGAGLPGQAVGLMWLVLNAILATATASTVAKPMWALIPVSIAGLAAAVRWPEQVAAIVGATSLAGSLVMAWQLGPRAGSRGEPETPVLIVRTPRR